MRKSMFRKGLTLAIIVLFFGASAVQSTVWIEKSTIGRDILYVGGSGEGNYTKIQDAIDNATDGDTVFVYDDSSPYIENVIVHKSINLIGENWNTTIIDGSNNKDTINVTANYVNISSFTIINGSWYTGGIHSGLKLYNTNNSTISKCNFKNNYNGLLLIDSLNNTIFNCTISANERGIYLISSKNNSFMENYLFSNTYGAFLSNSHKNTFIENSFINNQGNAIHIASGSYNLITNNSILDNKGWGLKSYGENTLIFGNNITSNHRGIYLSNSNNNTVKRNIVSLCDLTAILLSNANNNSINSNFISSNGEHGILVFGPFYFPNKFYHNSFINNSPNVQSTSYMDIWDDGYPSGGNYWDDYTGIDADGDGIGDTPYNISGGSNQDLYPLMYPWYPTHPDTVYVDDDYNESTPGWGYDRFNRIQYGINEVPENGTVYVYNGTYYENVFVDKSLNLIGENNNTTIINGNGSGDVIHITGEMVNVSEFSITNSGSDNFDAGIEIVSPSKYCNISSNNIYKNNVRGIWLRDAHNNRIINNTISSNKIYGIQISHSNDNNVSKNTILVNNTCVYIYTGINNSISENIITSNNRFGISLWSDSYGNTILNNCINSYQDNGIEFWLSYSNIFVGNYINSHNFYCINFRDSTNNNHFYHNNFFSNKETNAYDLGNNIWDNGYPSGGNYWSNYTGDDLYNGPNQDIPGPDGIGDTPYNISGGDNQDLYPLMHLFEMYYILNISAPSEVNEGELFNVLVTSIGGPVVPLATVEFNDELKFSDSDGRVYFIAPLVETDTYYDINATKEGYTGDTETILIKDVPGEFISTFIFGRLDNLTTAGEIITLEALNIRAITFFPFTFNHYTSGELLTISKDYFGLVGARFIFAFCGLAYQSSTSKISMNKFSQDDSANTVIWLVSGVEGNPVETKDVEMILLNESGEPQPDAEITFNEVNVEGYINPGDTFTVVAPSDGYYIFMLTHKISGATIYKGSLTHY